MENQFDNDEEALRQERFKQRIAEMKLEKEKREKLQENIKNYGKYGVLGLVVIIILVVGICLAAKGGKGKDTADHNGAKESIEVAENTETVENLESESGRTDSTFVETSEQSEGAAEQSEGTPGESMEETQPAEEVPETPYIPVGDVMFLRGYTAKETADTVSITDEKVLSKYAVLIDAYSGEIVAQKEAKTRMNPASMTKVLTVLVAAEHVTNLDDQFTVTLEMTDYAFVNDCSAAGFMNDETVTVRDLFYGTVLPSGGEAAVALATYVAGSHEAFVEMMNEKLEELGLAETAHFTNCVGLYDKEHYCTVYDMAMILKAALENDFCREVLGARTYNTSITEQHPEGILLSNWFLRRIEDKDTGGEMLGGKTGYVDESGSCAASYEVSNAGTPYICVTGKSSSSWNCINDHVAIYSRYVK